MYQLLVSAKLDFKSEKLCFVFFTDWLNENLEVSKSKQNEKREGVWYNNQKKNTNSKKRFSTAFAQIHKLKVFLFLCNSTQSNTKINIYHTLLATHKSDEELSMAIVGDTVKINCVLGVTGCQS